MLTFLENTWLLWWLLAIILILQWFHAISRDTQDEASANRDEFPVPKVRRIRDLSGSRHSVARQSR